MQNITVPYLVELRVNAAHLGKRAMWAMPKEVFQKIRRLKDEDGVHVYPPCWEGDALPPLLGLPIDVSSTYPGVSIIPITGIVVDDTVNHPKHYTSHPSGIECIQITEHMGFNLGNATKYIWRADLKHDAIEDLRKAKWYIERELKKRG